MVANGEQLYFDITDKLDGIEITCSRHACLMRKSLSSGGDGVLRVLEVRESRGVLSGINVTRLIEELMLGQGLVHLNYLSMSFLR